MHSKYDFTHLIYYLVVCSYRGLGGSALLFLLPSELQYIALLSSHALYPTQLSLQELFLHISTHEIPSAIKFKNADEMSGVIIQRRLEGVVHGNRYLLGASRQVRIP